MRGENFRDTLGRVGRMTLEYFGFIEIEPNDERDVERYEAIRHFFSVTCRPLLFGIYSYMVAAQIAYFVVGKSTTFGSF
jgi:hypothetical protein